MRYSRTGVVAVLLAAEVFIGGAILSALSGGRGWSMPLSRLHHVSQEGKTFAPIEAGNAPHVVIDDPDSRVVISPSTDGKVHVTDGWRTTGWEFGNAGDPPLSVHRTGDGVSIRRAEEHLHVGILIFIDTHRTEVALPPGAALEIRRCAGADVSGLSGSVALHSVDGSIRLSSVRATSLKLASNDGSLRLEDVEAPSIDAATRDGSIRATNLRVGGGSLHSDDGSVRIGLGNANVTVHAQTADGSIRFNGRRVAQDTDAQTADYQVGTGDGSLRVSTQDGSIHINTNGVL